MRQNIRCAACLTISRFVRPCNEYEQSAVELYLIERVRLNARDQCEAQAAQFGAAVIVDDTWGREIAEKSESEVHGAFWLVQQFYSLGLLSASATRESGPDLAATVDRGLKP